jgi:hypothetical protein
MTWGKPLEETSSLILTWAGNNWKDLATRDFRLLYTTRPTQPRRCKLNEKESKFHRDVTDLVIRAIRAGASTQSVKLVFNIILNDIERSEPYIRAVIEKDLAP